MERTILNSYGEIMNLDSEEYEIDRRVLEINETKCGLVKRLEAWGNDMNLHPRHVLIIN